MTKSHDRAAGHVFDLAQLVIDGRPLRAMRLYCYRCGKPGNAVMNSLAYGAGSEKKEDRMAARKFANMGWDVDLSRGKHFCPECRVAPPAQGKVIMKEDQDMARAGSNSKQADTSVVAMIPVINGSTPAPARTMEREDRRVIFEKLNEAYIDDQHGYAPPWTDDMIARELGCPRAWVAQVRDEMFGPVGSNSNIDDAIKAAKQLAAELVKHNEQASKLSSAADSMLKQLETITKAVGR